MDGIALALARAGDAALSRDGGPLRPDGLLLRVAPFAFIALVSLVLTLIPGGAPDAESAHLGAAVWSAVLFALIVIAVISVPWSRMSAEWQGLIPLVYMVVVLLLRHSLGSTESGYTVLYILPVAWLALYSPDWQVIAGVLLSAVFIIAPPVLDGPLLGEQHYPDSDYVLAVIVILVIAFVAALLRFTTNAAAIDPLTGLPNRRVFMAGLRRRADSAMESGRDLSVAVIDLDHFKHFNDSRGHGAGDRLLEGTALRWMSLVRDEDIIGRIGGEEFGLVVQGDTTACAAIADRLIHSVPEGQTASAGVAAVPPGADPMDALRRADIALYEAKHAGRARVSVAD
jgi:diguanylate cyclase (GGDEF)-like protein